MWSTPVILTAESFPRPISDRVPPADYIAEDAQLSVWVGIRATRSGSTMLSLVKSSQRGESAEVSRAADLSPLECGAMKYCRRPGTDRSRTGDKPGKIRPGSW